jgi:hypothetical protein
VVLEEDVAVGTLLRHRRRRILVERVLCGGVEEVARVRGGRSEGLAEGERGVVGRHCCFVFPGLRSKLAMYYISS